MRILDLRPAAERFLAGRWSAAQGKPVRAGLAARLWSRLVDDNMARRASRRAACPAGPAILSVGNLALGGTGKTPVIMALARALAGQGYRGGVLTRGFKSPLKGPLGVKPDNLAAGDEARLMAQQLDPLGWPVIQARDRYRGLMFLLDSLPQPDFVLVEDGHQTRKLGRHLDILILDRWTEVEGPEGPLLQPEAGPVFPFGPYRETARGSERAGILLVESDRPVPGRGSAGQDVATFTRRLELRPAPGNPGPDTISGPYAALSGIARPGNFEKGLARAVGTEPDLVIRLADHQRYSRRLVRMIMDELDAGGGLPLVTTAKDWVKLAAFWPAKRPVLVADLELEWGQPNALPLLVAERVGKPDLGGR